MLVLSRKVGEKVRIDGNIELEVLEVRGNRIRLGISAPLDCRIVRAECAFDPPTPVLPLRKPNATKQTCSTGT